MPKFNLYSAWMDPVFYVWAAVFAAALFVMVYSIRKYLELKNTAFDEEEPETPADPGQDDFVLAANEEPRPVQPELPAEEDPGPPPAAAAEAAAPNRAETFVRGIYEGISGLDARLKGIEASLAKSRVNNDFTVKFLEDILQDMETLDKAKIKARIEYLLSDLKK